MSDQFYKAAAQAPATADSDPRTACFHARRALELAVTWAFKFDGSLRSPYDVERAALEQVPAPGY